MKEKQQTAFTGVGTYPPFLNITEYEDGSAKVTVRGVDGTSAAIVLNPEEWGSFIQRWCD